MAHLLIIELPGGNDADILEAAIHRGDTITFLTSRLDHYKKQPDVWRLIVQAHHILDFPTFSFELVTDAVWRIHSEAPIDAVLCLLDIRLVEAACLATLLGARHVTPETALLLRDKYSVRCLLHKHNIAQPEFRLAQTNDELKAAVASLGLPVLIKPSDGYGSQNIAVLCHPHDIEPWLSPLEDMLPSHTDYGLGVRSNDRLLVERLMEGTVLGCDTLSVNGVHKLIGIHEKLFFEAPSFAIKGSCFSTAHPQWVHIQDYLFRILDTTGFASGATHTELMLTPDGPRLIEVNGRLVGAKIARLVNYALDFSFHSALIEAHLGHMIEWPPSCENPVYAVTRWITAKTEGFLQSITLPDSTDPRIRCVEMLKQAGDFVRPPLENADRIGYIMVCAETRAEAERLAEEFVRASTVTLEPLVEQPVASTESLAFDLLKIAA